MRIAYLDCNAGLSGNMFLGALLDLGYPQEMLKTELKKLPVPIPEFLVKRVSKNGITATWFEVNLAHEHHHRHLSEIINIIEQAKYSQTVTENAIRCFKYLAEAEAKIHGVSVEEIHFHEVGAIDAIIDIVGACLGIDFLQINHCVASPIRVGFGMVKCAHGEIPIPAPAALELLSGFTIFGGGVAGEWTTPTGAAILKTFAVPGNSIPQLKIEKIGYGAGTAERPIPNVHRIIIGSDLDIAENDFQVVLETNIDDLNPEIYGFLGEELLRNGARDFYFTSVLMKKGRPGTLITVVAPPEQVSAIETVLFKETSTLGIRKYMVQRNCLKRDFLTVCLSGCAIKIKIAFHNGKILKYAPEYNDCLEAARTLNRPLKDIYEEAIFQFRKMHYHEGSL